MPKHYLTKNTAKPVEINGRSFKFEPVSYFEPTHSWWGVYLAETSQDIADLDAAVQARLITTISKADYDDYQVKKKTSSVSKNYIDFGVKHNPQVSVSSGKPAEVVEDHQSVKTPTIAPESLDDVLAVKPAKKGR